MILAPRRQGRGAAEVWGTPPPPPPAQAGELCRRSWGKEPPLGSRAAPQPFALKADSFDNVCFFFL